MVTSLLASLALASSSLQVVAEPATLVEGQTGTLHVMVVQEGNQGPTLAGGATPRIDIPPQVDLRYRGLSQSFQSNGAHIRSVFDFRYALTGLDDGEHEIGPVTVRLTDGTTLRADPISLTVTVRAAGGDTPEQELELFAGFEQERVWEGQVALYHYGLTTSLPGTRATWRLPEFEGLRAPQHGQPAERQYTVEDGEKVFSTYEGTVPLIATGTGTLDIPAARASVALPGRSNGSPWGSRFRPMREETRVTDAVSLRVEPLPQPPSGFSGVVGEVVASARLDRGVAEVGDSVELVIDVRSDGSLEGMALPAYEPEGASVYEDDSAITGRVREGRYEGSARFRRVIVPTEEGTLALPDLELVTFSPSKGDYETHRLVVGQLEVAPGREGSGGEVQSYAADEVPDLPDEPEVVLEGPFTWGFASTPRLVFVVPLLLVGAAAPGVVTLTGQGMAWVRRRWQVRREQADTGPPTPFSYLRGLPDEPSARLAAYDSALRQSLANREGVSIGALDRGAAIDALPDDVAALVVELTRRLDRARYGGADFGDLETAVRKVIGYVEAA